MSIRTQCLINTAMILLSWLSILFLGSQNIRRFFPASILTFLVCCIDANIGKQRRWWSFYNKPQSFFRDELPFLAGPFMAGSMWGLKLGHGNFKKFITLNAIMEIIFAYPLNRLCKKLKVYKLVGLNKFQFFLLFFYKAFILYGFQSLFENKKEK
ncbi:hypothetical protein J7E63_07330 [Bacillus sp. ISL-75]|uniref:hypothetical protein n=1 Tax=Bacillus sp. ISL-75 TaxID=2819137 RepID=UPI001BE51D0C|nr:hypothetical protein [Bacillus sp. ISL-75]MBT2726748.1 hypothetical protein [Bacillus sp. ISL-75]